MERRREQHLREMQQFEGVLDGVGDSSNALRIHYSLGTEVVYNVIYSPQPQIMPIHWVPENQIKFSQILQSFKS